MAVIYLKSNNPLDQTLVLDPREGLLRQTNFGTAWNEVRIGMFYSAVALTGNDNAPPTAQETVSNANAIDQLTFGLKDSSVVPPGFAGTLFLGLATGANLFTSNNAGNGFTCCQNSGGTNQGTLAATGFAGVTMVNGAVTTDNLANLVAPVTPGAATSYSAFYALRFVVSNPGQSTQSVIVSWAATSPWPTVADLSVANLRNGITASIMNGSSNTYNNPRTIAWNSGGVARTLPDSFWLRIPLSNTKIRISAIDAIKLS